jgi:hypothetical protein
VVMQKLGVYVFFLSLFLSFLVSFLQVGNRAQIVGVLDRCAAARGRVDVSCSRYESNNGEGPPRKRKPERERERERERESRAREKQSASERARGVSKTEKMSSSNPRTTFYYYQKQL